MDWNLKVKIGGLGVMSSLMGKAMTDVDLIWVIPKVKDLDYPPGDPYLIRVETHVVDHITYVILDSPVFRTQIKADPYPARMDNLSSAIFYSAWNQAIAATIRRYSTIDVYHINDYHSGLAPIYLLPKVVPVCLSLYNAEFQGLWPLRTKEEMREICSAFNVTKEHCAKRVWVLRGFRTSMGNGVGRIAALDEKPVKTRGIKVDRKAEAARPELKRQAQEWAGIEQDPKSNLFVFVGRWSKQKGVDLIADIGNGQVDSTHTIGPVIDLYGHLAAEKLARLMEMHPGCVYSKPEFTALPPFLFSRADFALIPSRDEPFGLVAVEFGRKGALGVGSRLGGLGLMPGWWFPVELSSWSHMLSQLTKTIKMALKSTDEERALLRARSAVQRFPVVEWRQRIEDFHRRSITMSRQIAEENAWRPTDGDGYYEPEPVDDAEEWDAQAEIYPSYAGLSHSRSGFNSPDSSGRASVEALVPITNEPINLYSDRENHRHSYASDPGDDLNAALDGVSRAENHPTDYENFLERVNRTRKNSTRWTPKDGIAIASFTDADGSVTANFGHRLGTLNAKNSEHGLSIEKYLMKSEETFFSQVRKKRISSASASIKSRGSSTWGSSDSLNKLSQPGTLETEPVNYNKPPVFPRTPPPEIQMNRIQIALAREIKGWPLYTIMIALGQMLSATSFQMTLLAGRNWQSNTQLYIIGGVFLLSSIVWYPLCRIKPARYALSLPWLFFGVAFLLIGLPSVTGALHPVHTVLSDVATWCYAIASAAGFLFFALNFGEEAGAATEVWVFRACIVQGSQQVWVAALWYWGYTLNNQSPSYVAPWWLAAIVWPLSVMSFMLAFVLFRGLPEYYRQSPPKVSHFLTTLFRRKLVIWFFISEILRDYWLSGPYGLNILNCCLVEGLTRFHQTRSLGWRALAMSLIPRLYDQHHSASFMLDSVYTEVVIVDVHASVLLSQRFTRPPIATLNAVYTFGLMADTAVCGFEMVRGDGMSVRGVIKNKTEAKEEYDKAVRDGFTAGLAKEETKDVFTIYIGNILPSETVTINLRLLQRLTNDEKNNEVKFVFPCTYTYSYGQLSSPDAGFVTSIYQHFEMNVFIQQAGPIQRVSCPSGYPISIAFGLPQSFNTPFPVVNTENASHHPHDYAHVTLKDPFGSLTRDVVLIISVTDLDSPRCFIEPHPSPNYNTTTMALTFVPKFTIPDLSNSDSNPGMEYLFLIDRSGSMNQHSRMPLVKETLVVLLRGLPTKHTTFNLLSFGSRTTKLWESSRLYTQETLNKATEHVEQVKYTFLPRLFRADSHCFAPRFLSTMTANYGGTKILEALQIAFSSLSNPLTRPVAVFLLTDGSSWDVQNCICTVENATQTLAPPENPGNSKPLNRNAFLRVFTQGIGDGASSDMCDSIARAGHGISIYVREGEEMVGKCARLVRGVRTPPVEVEILWPEEEKEPSFVAPQDDDWNVIDHEYTVEAMGEDYVDIRPAIPGPVYALPGSSSLSDPEISPSQANSFLWAPDSDSLPRYRIFNNHLHF
ncbi:glycosyltransferase family 5 protein [Collybiopsis luxurians FD-317 M1]|uniref:alpha-1,3-glucan synthase n=1 Tax=Collybiopsis luxurians FD-317 M1 TaxID=944289 RepID=A0A0D0C285_9AGAR|nr:glycosyltransferase family 5 protein [Collybiopsis luxurians FD-317 M1]